MCRISGVRPSRMNAGSKELCHIACSTRPAPTRAARGALHETTRGLSERTLGGNIDLRPKLETRKHSVIHAARLRTTIFMPGGNSHRLFSCEQLCSAAFSAQVRIAIVRTAVRSRCRRSILARFFPLLSTLHCPTDGPTDVAAPISTALRAAPFNSSLRLAIH